MISSPKTLITSLFLGGGGGGGETEGAELKEGIEAGDPKPNSQKANHVAMNFL